MQSGSRKQIDSVRLKADLAAASVEVLSAHCAVDRLRLNYSPQDVVSFADPKALKRAITSAEALWRFFGHIARQLELKENPGELR